MEREPIFFTESKDFREWLMENHKSDSELWVGYYKKSTGTPSITWPESVDQALCFGWIDGIRKTIDEKSYKIRFTPRKPTSHWSHVNIRKVKELKKNGLMLPEGLTAFNNRKENRSGRASYEQKNVKLERSFEIQFKANRKGWKYFSKQPPSYKKTSIWWVMSAKKDQTRQQRLNVLIRSSEENCWIPQLRWTKKPSG